MKHLFIYILCSILCCGAYAQTNAQSPPPGVKFRTMKAEKAMRSGKFGKEAAFMQQQKAAKIAPQAKSQSSLLRNRIGKPVPVMAPRLQSAKPIEGDQARIILNVQSDWGDGSGYQVILDKECEITSMQSLDEIFAAADYTIPENAVLLENFLMAGESASIDIPAGEYDFYVFNPTPSSGTVYIAGGESVGDNYYFRGGVEYIFTVNVLASGSGDLVEISTDSPVEIGVSEILSPVSSKDLGAEESVTAKIFNSGTEEITSFVATMTVDGGQPVSETVNTAIAPGDSIEYTFTAKADLSAAGVHSLAVSVEHEKDGLPTNNSVTTRIIHIAAVEAPYVCAFDNESCINEWTIIDANNDGYTWTISLDEQCAKILYNSLNKTDDYLVTVCPIILGAGTNNIALEYNAMSSSYYESFEILYGKTSNVNEMTVLKKYENFPASEEILTAIVNFETEEAGEYFFAIHATSEADQMGFEIYNVAISEGAYIGEPDLTLDKVIMPLPSCSLGDAEKVSAKISNKGTAGAIGFTLEYSVNGEAKGSQTYEVAVPVGETVTVDIDANLDLSATGKHLVGINITNVTPEVGQNPEAITDNNYAESYTTHFTPTDVPFIVDFTDENQRNEWASDESWLYDGDYYNALYCYGTTPLVSRGVNLKAGETYRISYNYMAGMFYFLWVIYDNYDIIIGKDGTPLSEWSTLASFTDVYTDDVFTDNEVTFTVPSDGVYSLGFKQDLPQATLMLSSVTIDKVSPYDAKITGISSLPSMLPKSQAENLTIDVAVKNNGSETISGDVAITISGKEVGTAKFENIPASETSIVSVPVTIGDIPTGNTTVEAEATIDGHDDTNTADNVASVSLAITEDVYAYDYTTDDMYNEYNAIGTGDGYPCTAGIIFHINKEASLKGMSIGWGIVTGEQIGLAAYKWDATAQPDAEGYLPVGEEVFSTTADQGTSIGQIEYKFDESATLTPGDYILTVSYTGYALATDQIAPGQLYLLVDNEGTLNALDQTPVGLGTPAIRAILGESGTVGIGTIEANAKAPAIVYDAASKTIVATSPASAIKSLTVYSASGTQMGNKAGSTNVCRYDASRLAPGVYVVQMNTADGIVTSKLAIK